MNEVLGKLTYIILYMHDGLIPARSFEEGMTRLHEVFSLIKGAGRKITAITNCPIPKKVHNVRQFIDLASFFRSFLKNFALIIYCYYYYL